jgi:hypothetical protein
MFAIIILFFLSFILEIMLFILTSPDAATGQINHLFVIVFSINSGVLMGTMYCFLLLGFYLFAKAQSELQNKAFVRRGVLFGILISTILLFKLYEFLDYFILTFLILVFIASELILSQKSEV